jgi:glycosyltransferase involved in cell wall biosynthesis
MSKKYTSPPEDFDAEIYQFLNKDLKNYSTLESKIHFIVKGFNENRKYKLENELPIDFDPAMYKYYNPDLISMSDLHLKIHYLKHGISEGRVYRIELPNDFDVKTYGLLNKDITNMPNGWLEMHYFQHGKKENRKYKDDLFNEEFFIKENNVQNYSGYEDYLKDIRQIKSKKLKELINKIKEIKDCILLVSHENSIYGATNYLYTIYKMLKKTNENIILIDDFENGKLLNKFGLKRSEVLFYEGDPTLLYWMCVKINPKLIYFNSMNSQIADVVKFIDKSKYVIHSHEVRQHFTCDVFPSFVVSKRISEQYNSIPKIQQPIFTEDMIEIMNKNLKESFEVRNLNGPLNKNKITIGMCGSLTERKNYRLFIETAKELKDFNFLWVGGSETIESKEIPNLYHIKDTKRPHSYYKYMDYFVLFSNIDPCPYVVLENLYAGNKVLTFKENIYTDHKCDLLKDIYFEFDGEINLENAIKFIQETCLNKADRSNLNGKLYIEQNFTKLTQDILDLLN